MNAACEESESVGNGSNDPPRVAPRRPSRRCGCRWSHSRLIPAGAGAPRGAALARRVPPLVRGGRVSALRARALDAREARRLAPDLLLAHLRPGGEGVLNIEY